MKEPPRLAGWPVESHPRSPDHGHITALPPPHCHGNAGHLTGLTASAALGPVLRRCSEREVNGRCYQGIHTTGDACLATSVRRAAAQSLLVMTAARAPAR